MDEQFEIQNIEESALSDHNAESAQQEGIAPAVLEITPLSGTDPTPDPVVDNSKEYIEAPFEYIYSNNEAVSLNSGALNYEVTDFSLPGRNGFDLVVTRRYDSSQSNVDDIEYKTNNVLTTRPNDHDTSIYGVGQGWSFCFSSIESIIEQNGTVNSFLRLSDGRSYKIDASSVSGLKDYPLMDMKLTKASGISPVSYDHIISHKDGRKEYLKICGASPSQKSKLAAIEDRFGNLIKFTFNDNGGATVIDTLGRTIQLVKSGSTLTWTLPDSKTVEYTVSGNLLTKVKDPIGRITQYGYDSFGVTSAPLSGKSISLTYKPLKTITFPTGSQSVYTYANLTHQSEYGTLTLPVVSSRKDISGGNTYDAESFSYTTAYNSAKKCGYINQTTVTKSTGTVETHTFNNESLRTSEVIRYSGAIVSNKTFVYADKLLTQESMTVPFSKTVTRVYDNGTTVAANKKANLTKQTVTADGESHIADMTYDTANFNLLTSKTYKKDASTTIVEEYVLRSDKKCVELNKISENGALKQATGFTYDSRNRIVTERQYFDLSGNSPKASASDRVVNYSFENDLSLFPVTKSVSGIIDADGTSIGSVSEAYKYNIYGQITDHTDANGNKTFFTYDNIGRVIKTTNPDNTAAQIAYNDSLNQIVTTDENGNATRFEYTLLGQIARIYDPKTNTLLTDFEYDSNRRIIKEIEYRTGDKLITSYIYDYFSRPTRKLQTNAQGTKLYELQVAYDDPNNKETRTVMGDANAPAIVTTIRADKFDRIIEQGYGSNGTQYFDTYTYDLLDNRKTAQTSLDKARGVFSSKTECDYAGRAIKETNALVQSSKTEHDALGNKTKFTDYKGNITEYFYDVLGRLIRQVSPFDGGNKVVTKSYYDKAGNLTRQERLCNAPGKSQEWRKIVYIYDNRNRLVDTIAYEDNGAENRTRTVYDAVGNELAVYMGMAGNSINGAHKISYTYDHFGNILTMTDARSNTLPDSDPEKRIERYEYDKYGDLVRKTDRDLNVTSYTYDALGRLISETVSVKNKFVPVTTTNTNSYTLTGRKASSTTTEVRNGVSRSLTISYQYDDVGRLVVQNDPDNVKKTYSYDSDGNKTGFIMQKDGVTQINLAYSYDYLDRLVSVIKNGAEIAKYTYDENGNRKSLSYPQSGLATEYTYNSANLVTSLINRAGSAIRSSYAYTYSLDGNQTSKADHKGIRTDYVYDKLGRLAKESVSGGETREYVYDRYGNRIKMIVSGTENYITLYEYNENNCLFVEEKTTGKVGETFYYTYDYSGHQIHRQWEKEEPWDEEQDKGYYGEDPRSRCIGFVGENFHENVVTLERKEYNGFGKLIWVYRDTVQSVYTYRPDGLRHEKVVSTLKSASVTRHIWDGQNIIADANEHGVFARYIRGIGLIAREQDNLLQYYLFNAHGDVVQRTDHYGGVLKSYKYDAFGVERSPEKLDSNPFRFCGEYWDSDTETLYLRNRYYDPSIGRFGAEDPINDGLNWYCYCENDPVMNVDPSGLSLTSLISAALTVVAKATSTSVAKAISNTIKNVSNSSGKSSSSSSSSSSKSTSSSSSGSNSTSTGKSTTSSATSAKLNLGDDTYAVVALAPAAPTIIAGGIKGIAIIGGALVAGYDMVKNAIESKGKATNKSGKSLPNQGTVDGNVAGAPPVDAGKQGKHVPGHPNSDSTKTQWPEGQTGVDETQQGWQDGKTLPDGTRVWDSGRTVGPNGETGVRVHRDGKGNVHGYPVNPGRYTR